MSDVPPPPYEYRPPPADQRRRGCVFMLIVGIFLLLPGYCAGWFAIQLLREPNLRDLPSIFLALFGLMLGAAGIFLLVRTRS